MALDYEAIGEAIRARFATAATPASEDALALTTVEPPAQIGATPALIVHPPEEDLEWGPGGVRHSVQRWPVRFYRTEGDLGPSLTALSKWRKAFLDTVVGQVQLGLSTYVDWAEIRSVAVRQFDYAETRYDGLEFMVWVKTREPVTAAA